MDEDRFPLVRYLRRRPYIQVTGLYLLVGIVWILFSDALLAQLLGAEALNLTLLSMGKGIFYILTTGALLLWLMRRAYKQQQANAQIVRSSQIAYRYLFINNPLPMWIYDLATLRFVEVNDAALAKYGYSREEFLTMTLYDIRPPDEYERLRQNLLRPRPVYEHSTGWRHRLKDGRIIEVEISSHLLEWQERPAALVIAQDVTERNQTQRALEESEARLNRILNSMQDAVWVADAKTQHLIYANPTAAVLMGLSEVGGEDAMAILERSVHPEDREQVLQSTLEMLQKRLPSIVQTFRVVRLDGEVRWVRQGLNLIEEDETLLLEGISADITDRVEAEMEHQERERLRALLEKEEAIHEQRQRFLSMVSHEFRTPFTIISSSLEMIQRYGDRMDPAQHSKHLDRALSNVRRANDLLNDMLLLSRMEAVTVSKSLQPLDAEALCEEIASEIRDSLPDGLTLVYEPLTKPAILMSDPKILRQIVTNLLSNAIKYSPAGGTVTLRLRSAGAELCICVQDEGIGIPEEAIPTLFEPFVRASNAQEISGTGLGLAIVKMGVDQHGGYIKVESKEGKGSIFRVYLPIAQPSLEASAEARPQDAH